MHRNRNAGRGQRTNVQGRLLDGAETTKRSGLSAGTRREFTFMVKHGLLMCTSEAPRIFSWSFDKTSERWRLDITLCRQRCCHHLSQEWEECQLTGLGTPLRIIDSSRTSYCTTQRRSPRDIILNNGASLDAVLAEDRYKQNLRKLEIVPSFR